MTAVVRLLATPVEGATSAFVGPGFHSFYKSGSAFNFSFEGPTNTDLVIEMSSNLVAWSVWTNVHADFPSLGFTDVTATNRPVRFYRARTNIPQSSFPPELVYGFEFSSDVQVATGSFLPPTGVFASPAIGQQTMLLAFDHLGDFCTWTMANTYGGGSKKIDSEGIGFTYLRQNSKSLVSLFAGTNRVDMVLTFASATNGSYTATHAVGGPGTLSGSFILNPMPVLSLATGVWTERVTGTFGRQHHYRITVPEGCHQLVVRTEQAITNNSRLCYLGINDRAPASPVRHRYYADRHYLAETITVRDPAAGDWYVMLKDGADYREVRLLAQYSAETPLPLAVQPAQQTVPAGGGTNQAAIISTNGGTWVVTNEVNWILILSPLAGLGDATLLYTVAANATPTARTGTIRVGDQVLTINQAAGSGSGDFAPETINGKIVTITDSTGIVYAPITFTDGTHFSMPAAAPSPAMNGTYTYTKTEPNVAGLVMTVTSSPMTGRIISVPLTFTTGTSGAFMYSATGGGVPNYQMTGSFTTGSP